MRTRNRNREEGQRGQASDAATGSGARNADGEDLRSRARRLLELGDQTISHALSQNSEQFLEQNRQQGGQ